MCVLKLKNFNNKINNLEADNKLFAIELLNKFGPKLRNLIKNELMQIELTSEKCKVLFLLRKFANLNKIYFKFS